MNSHFDQNRFKVRFETYLDLRIPKKPEHTQFPNQSWSQTQAQPIRVEHYYQDAWWYFPISNWNMYPSPPSQTIIHNNHYYTSNNRRFSDNQMGQGQMQKQKDEKDKNKVGLDDILKGVFVGSILVGSSYVLFNSYLDWYDERCLLKDIKAFKDSSDLDDQNLYNMGKHILKKNCCYSRDIFLTKLGLIGSACVLLLDYNYWDNEQIMNVCLIGGTLTGIFGMVRYTLFHRYLNDQYTQNCYTSLKEIIQSDNKVHPPDDKQN